MPMLKRIGCRGRAEGKRKRAGVKEVGGKNSFQRAGGEKALMPAGRDWGGYMRG